MSLQPLTRELSAREMFLAPLPSLAEPFNQYVPLVSFDPVYTVDSLTPGSEIITPGTLMQRIDDTRFVFDVHTSNPSKKQDFDPRIASDNGNSPYDKVHTYKTAMHVPPECSAALDMLRGVRMMIRTEIGSTFQSQNMLWRNARLLDLLGLEYPKGPLTPLSTAPYVHGRVLKRDISRNRLTDFSLQTGDSVMHIKSKAYGVPYKKYAAYYRPSGDLENYIPQVGDFIRCRIVQSMLRISELSNIDEYDPDNDFYTIEQSRDNTSRLWLFGS